MHTTVTLNNFKLIDWEKLFPRVLLHSGRTDVNGGHFDLLNKSKLGLYHYHHREIAHLHPCRFGITYYNLEDPTYNIKRKLGFATIRDLSGVNYFPVKQVLPALPMTTFTESNKRFQMDTTQQYASSHNLEEVKYRPIEITIDCSTTENESWVPQNSIKIYDSINWINLNLDLKFFFKDGELHISIDDAMKIVNLDNYYKRVSLDSENCYHFEITTQTHDEIDRKGRKHEISDANIWTSWNAVVWKLKDIVPGGQTSAEYVHDFKIEWIHSYKDAIKAAADEYHIPMFLLAGVMYVEVAGQPPILDSITYYFRDTFAPEVLDGIADFVGGAFRRLPGRDIATSFGDISMQIRVAAEVLDYPNPNHLCNEEVYLIIDSLKAPEIGLFICASHLSDLKNVDFPYLTKEQLTDDNIRIISTRYNRGSARTLEEILSNTSYGDRIIANKVAIMNALE